MPVVDLAYAEAGAGVPVVLLHAFPVHRALLAPQLDHLAETHHVVTPDLRGFGESPLGEDPPSLDAMADDVVALLDRLGLDRVLLGGVSMGGYVTMAVLRRHPSRLRGLLLLDTKGGADTEEARQNRLRVAAAVEADGSAALRPMLDGLLGDTTRERRPDVVARVTGWIDEVDPAAAAWAQRAMAGRPDSFDDLRRAGLPAAVVVGAEDTLTPHSEAVALADAIGDDLVPEVQIVSGAGHLSPIEAPAATSAALLHALDRLSGRGVAEGAPRGRSGDPALPSG